MPTNSGIVFQLRPLRVFSICSICLRITENGHLSCAISSHCLYSILDRPVFAGNALLLKCCTIIIIFVFHSERYRPFTVAITRRFELAKTALPT